MTINRKFWEGSLYPLPGWLCPVCQSGHYRTLKDAHAKGETKASREARDQPEWEAEWVEHRYVTLLRCDNPSCKEIASLAATTNVDERYEWVAELDRETPVRVDTYQISFIDPAPVPILLSDQVPSQINGLLKEAASAYWFDVEASANKLRQVAEEIMTERGIARFKIETIRSTGKKVRKPIMLHQRIQTYQSQAPDVAEMLLAVKWIGNAGSHVGSLKQTDVLDGFEMLDHVLGEIYRKDKVRLTKLAKKVNKRRGPSSAKKRKKKRKP